MLALFVAGLPFSISAAIGFISLLGVSVMNGILVLTYFNELRLQGMTPFDAMERAAEKRMRPMLMTALSACIGLVPAAFSHGIGSQVQRPLATVVVGGMLLGPIMLLVVVPALQLVFLRKTHDQSLEPATESNGPGSADVLMRARTLGGPSSPCTASHSSPRCDERAVLHGTGRSTGCRSTPIRRRRALADAAADAPIARGTVGRHIEIDGARIWYAEWGQVLRTRLLLHGGFGNSNYFGKLIPALAAHGYRVIAMDSRGPWPKHPQRRARSATI